MRDICMNPMMRLAEAIHSADRCDLRNSGSDTTRSASDATSSFRFEAYASTSDQPSGMSS